MKLKSKKHMNRLVTRLALTAVVSLPAVVAVPALAQGSTADILGVVIDSTGAVIPRATVTILNLDTGEKRTIPAAANGEYSVTALQVGRYSVSVSNPGFATFQATNVNVSAGDRIRVDAHLNAGSSSETVTVTAATADLKTDTSAAGDTIDAKSVQDLPLNGRNFVQLVQITAGVNAAQPNSVQNGNRNVDRRQGGAYSANGQSEIFNNNMVDGLDNNERSSGLIVVRPSVEGIQEISVLTNGYSAEVGRAAGAVVNVITKAGTNAFHGSAFEYIRNDIFDARLYFARTGRKPEFRQNQFGGSFGGPVFKDKTFFFVDAEDLRVVNPFTQIFTVPTAYEEANIGNFSDIGGPVVPTAAINPIGLAYFKLYPTPNVAGSPNSYQGTARNTQNALTTDARVDHHFNANNTLFARYSYNPVTTVTGSGLPAVNGIQPGGILNGITGTSTTTTQSAQLDYIHIFGPNFLAQAKGGYIRYDSQTLPLNYGTNASATLGLQNVNLPSVPGTSGLALFFPTGYSPLGDALFLPLMNKNNTYLLNGSMTYTHGGQTIKAGGALIKRELSVFQNQYGVGAYAFSSYPGVFRNSLQAMLLGTALQVARANQLSAQILELWEPSIYVQDDWRVRPSLTLNLGIRYEVFPPPTEKRNRLANFNLNTLQMDVASDSNKHADVNTKYGSVSPRIGFAFSPTKDFVLRGGFGISYYPANIQSTIAPQNVPTFFTNTSFFQSVNKPLVTPTAINPATFATNSSITNITASDPNLSTAYIEQFHLEAQQKIGGGVLTVGYVGELGRKLFYQTNPDLPAPPGPGGATPAYRYKTQLPYIVNIQYSSASASSSYNALTAQFERRTVSGFVFNGNYTLAHGLTNSITGTGYNGTAGVTIGVLTGNPRYDYGNSDLDVRNRVAGSIAYQLPFGKSFTGLKAVAFKGFQLNTLGFWQTGLPFTVIDATVQANGLANINLPGQTTDRPNMLRSAKLANPTLGQFFDTSAFQQQTVGTAGNEARNQIYGPHDRRFDLSLFKNFPVYREFQAQFRAECFNILNLANFATPNNQISAVNANGTPASGTQFGTITSTNQAETPRQLQFALKVQF